MEKNTETKLSQCGRNIIYDNNENISLYSYAKKMIDVYGDNAKIGLCFLLATTFKDIIVRHTRTYPILNLYGPKGTGKSEMGHSLMSFFKPHRTSFNLKYSNISDLNDVVAKGSNVLVHLDEFDNSVGIEKREYLKGIWDNTGLCRINKDKEREFTYVGNGVIISGQEMATSDIALFSRFVFLCFYQSEYNDEERTRLQELKKIEGLGLSHLTLEIISLRREMSLNFERVYNECAIDVSESIKQRYIKVEERIFRNWLILVATFKTLHKFLTLPFSYDNIRELCVDMMILQSRRCRRYNEPDSFWAMISHLSQSREIYPEVDFKIKEKLSLHMKGGRIIMNNSAKQYLYIRKHRIFQLYQYHSKLQGAEKPIDKSLLNFFLMHSSEFVGEKQAVRFKNRTEGIEANNKGQSPVCTTNVAQAMIFDYDLIKKRYGITLDTDDESKKEV